MQNKTGLSSGSSHQVSHSGMYRYIQELWGKKQPDVMPFLLISAAGTTTSSLHTLHRASYLTWLDKAQRVRYKARQGYIIFEFAIVATNAQFSVAQLMASLPIVVVTSQSLPKAVKVC